MNSRTLCVTAIAVLLTLASTAMASTTWYVNGVTGSDGNDCKSPTTACKTIGHAISLSSSGDSISVAAATYTENITIGISLKVIGAGAMTTIIDGGAAATVVTISSASAHVTLSRLTIRNGFALHGAGIFNQGTLVVRDSTVTLNLASGSPAPAGGGIYNFGILTVDNSTVSGNTASSSCTARCSADGGGIYSFGTLAVSNSTISGNFAVAFLCQFQCGASGGGVLGVFVVSNSTISGNEASGGAGSSSGGGISGTASLQNSIVADNSGGNCSGTMTSNGYNLSSDGTCNFNNTGDLNNTDPKLGPLQSNGGQTQTQALLPGSPAIDAGNPSGCTDGQGRLLKTDQRGAPRPDKEDTGGCDMGAYERQTD